MKSALFAVAIAASSLTLTACETTSARPYETSTQNVLAFQSAFDGSAAKVQVADFSAAEGVDVEPSCRLLGALEVAPGKTPMEFLEDAMRDELFEAGVYGQNSNTVLKATVTELVPDSVGTGSWKIGMNVSSNLYPQGIDVATDYSFKTSYTAIKACQNVIDAFTPATQDLLSKLAKDENFGRLVGTTRGVASLN